MKEKWFNFKRKTNKVTVYLWGEDFDFLMLYLTIMAILCIITKLIHGTCLTFILVIIGTLVGRAIGYRLRVMIMRKKQDKEK